MRKQKIGCGYGHNAPVFLRRNIIGPWWNWLLRYKTTNLAVKEHALFVLKKKNCPRIKQKDSNSCLKRVSLNGTMRKVAYFWLCWHVRFFCHLVDMSDFFVLLLTCQIFLSSCQIFMQTCQISMFTCHLLTCYRINLKNVLFLN